MHTIYHVLGIKVGCTNNFERRCFQNEERYGEDIDIEILEVLEDVTDQEAGDIEWKYADQYGYPRGAHYTANWNKLTPEQRTEARTAGGHIGGPIGVQSQIDDGIHISQKPGAMAEAGRVGVVASTKSSIAAGNHMNQQEHKCPHCLAEGTGPVMKRWHFDNCKTVAAVA